MAFFWLVLLVVFLPVRLLAQGEVATYPTRISFRATSAVIGEHIETLTVLSGGTPRNCVIEPISNAPIVDVFPRTGTTPFAVRVVSTAGFVPVAQYNATLRVSCEGTTSTVLVPVSLDATPRTTLYSDREFVAFNLQAGDKKIATKQIRIDSSTQAVGITTALDGNTNILRANEGLASTPRTINVTADTTQLTSALPGILQSTVRVTPTDGGNPLTLSVFLNLSIVPVGYSTSNSLEFYFQRGGLLPEPKVLDLLANNLPAFYLLDIAYDPISGVERPDWLEVVRRNSIMSESALVRVRPGNLPDGVHRATIVIRFQETGTILQIPVTFVIGSGTPLQVEARPIHLSYRMGGTLPDPFTLRIESPRGPQQYWARPVTPSVRNWLIVDNELGTAPNSIQISVDPTDLPPGVYEGAVEIIGSGMQGVPTKVPVRLNITDKGLLNLSEQEIRIEHPFGQASTRYQRLLIFTPCLGCPAPRWKATVLQANPQTGNWLTISGTEGSAPQSLGFEVDAAGLAPGTYRGAVYFKVDETVDAFQVLPVRLDVIDRRPLTLNPATISFFREVGAPNPQPLEVTLNTQGQPFDVRVTQRLVSGGNWITFDPEVTATGNRIRIGVNRANTLTPGRYQQELTFTPLIAGVEPVRVMAEFVVGYRVAAAPSELAFTATTLGAVPAARNVTLTSEGGPVDLQAAATTDSGGSWLTAQITTPGILSVSVRQSGLAPGTYRGTVRITGNNVQTLNIPVTFTVTQSQPATNLGVANAASFATGAVSPGAMVVLFGDNIGPDTLTGLQVQNGRLTTTLAQTQVLFEDTPAPLIYVSRRQTAAIVPFEMAGRTTARLRVIYQGLTYYDQQVNLAAVSPGVFTANQSGSGAVAALNADNSTNTPANAARIGQPIQLFLTGAGATNPAGETGLIVGNARPLQGSVEVRIGGVPAQVVYAGQAPGSVSGFTQINAIVPPGAPVRPDTPLTVLINGVAAQSNLTVAIREP